MRFTRAQLASLDNAARAARLKELNDYLSARLRGAPDFLDEVGRLVMELRAEGHDLWSWDESDDFAIWGPDYTKPSMSGLIVDFRMDEGVDATWCEDADPTTVRKVFGEGLH